LVFGAMVAQQFGVFRCSAVRKSAKIAKFSDSGRSSMAEVIKKPRPEYRNIGIGQIIKYRLPLAGLISIAHRISGAILFFLLPFALYLFEQSLTSEITFDTLKGIASNIIVKLFILALSWAFLFHFCAGIRHLIMDTHYAVTKEGGRNTAVVVFTVSTLLTLAVALKLFGAF